MVERGLTHKELLVWQTRIIEVNNKYLNEIKRLNKIKEPTSEDKALLAMYNLNYAQSTGALGLINRLLLQSETEKPIEE